MSEDVLDEILPFEPDELTALPVFPLPRVVFFPGTLLPLHLFEPRYRAMMEDCLTKGPRAIAIALLAPGWEEDYEGRPPLVEIAGAGRIMDHAKRPDGRYDLVLQGVCRVRLSELPPDGLSYRRARASVLEDRISHPEQIAPLLQTVLASASTLGAMIRRRHGEFSFGIDATTPPGLVADRIADRLIGDVELRQQVLCQADVKVRLNIVQDAMMEVLAQIGGGAGDGFH